MLEVIFLMDPKKKAFEQKLREMENFAQSAGRVNSDVLGSYTGVPLSEDDPAPVQDADDL